MKLKQFDKYFYRRKTKCKQWILFQIFVLYQYSRVESVEIEIGENRPGQKLLRNQYGDRKNKTILKGIKNNQ